MFPDDVIEQLKNAGFQVFLKETRVFVGLQNRPVSVIEVSTVLDTCEYALQRNGDFVEISWQPPSISSELSLS